MFGSSHFSFATPLMVLIPLLYVAVVGIAIWALVRLAQAAERIAAALEVLAHRPEQR